MHRTLPLASSLLVCLLTGCPEEDSGLTESQVDRIIGMQESLSEERSALKDERTDLNGARDQLEADRRQWAERERRDPIIAEAITAAGLLLACCLPLVAAVLLLWPRGAEPDDAAVSDALIADSISEEPQLLGAPSEPDRPRLE